MARNVKSILTTNINVTTRKRDDNKKKTNHPYPELSHPNDKTKQSQHHNIHTTTLYTRINAKH